MDTLYLPNLHWFAMTNPFTGSQGIFRFRVVPNVVMATAKEVDFAQSSLRAEYWHGPYCYEKSDIEEEKVFPLTEEGRGEMLAWLQAHI